MFGGWGVQKTGLIARASSCTYRGGRGESISGRTVGGCTFLTPGMTILTVYADGVVVFYFIRYHMFIVFAFDRVAEFNFKFSSLFG